jgi:copper chaperone NosL
MFSQQNRVAKIRFCRLRPPGTSVAKMAHKVIRDSNQKRSEETMRKLVKLSSVAVIVIVGLSTPAWYASAGPPKVVMIAVAEDEQTDAGKAKDPICGMEVGKKRAEAQGMTAEHQGRKYYFCSHQCKQQFLKDPERFLKSETESNKKDVKQVSSCKNCGMNRQQFAHSRVLVVYDDGKREGFCSIHCAAVDLAVNIDRTPKRIFVGDYRTKELIDAENAFWVIGGSRSGVMTKRAKWAFSTREDADAFVKEFGGSRGVFDATMKATYEDMHQDTNMIRERRAMKRNAGQGIKMSEETHK